jgi:hypothetical protein
VSLWVLGALRVPLVHGWHAEWWIHFSGLNLSRDIFTAIDRDGNLIRASTVGRVIMVIIGRDEATNQKLEAEILGVTQTLLLSSQPPEQHPDPR